MVERVSSVRELWIGGSAGRKRGPSEGGAVELPFVLGRTLRQFHAYSTLTHVLSTWR